MRAHFRPGLSLLVLGFLTTALTACGGGGGGSSPPPPPPPPPAPSGLSYTAPPAFTLNTAIAQLSPTITGIPTSFSVSPALPAGLALNATNGIVSGTPTALQAATIHTVTATNGSGSTTATLTITVNDAVPAFSYPSSSYGFTTGVPVSPVAPSTSGGAVTSWSIDRTLPAGLSFNTQNGQITGTPTTVSAQSNYLVTAHNSGGGATFTLGIAVRSGVLVDLGHVQEITGIRYSGTRVMSVDYGGRVLLHDAQTGERIRTVEANSVDCYFPCEARAQLAGNTLAVRQSNGDFDVYSAQTGALLSQIDAPPVTGGSSPWKLASDGSYIVAGTSLVLSAWSVDGTLLFNRNGDYRNARMFAAPDQVRIAITPYVNQAIEYIAIPSGASTQSPPFIGTFNSWFQDGARFLTRANSTVLVYSQEGLQIDTATLPTVEGLNGAGNWFWTTSPYPYQLRIYAVGASATPAATYPIDIATRLQPSGPMLALLTDDETSVIDLSGSAPQKTDLSPTTEYNTSLAARSATDWISGDRTGLLTGAPGSGLPTNYNHGRVNSIAGSRSRLAVAVSSGQTLIFNAARNLEGTIAASSKLALSANGTVLGAVSSGSLRIYSMPSGNVLTEFPAQAGESLRDFTLSASGEVVGQVVRTSIRGSDEFNRRAMRLDHSVIWSDFLPYNVAYTYQSFQLSPSGLRVAASNTSDPHTSSSASIPGTNIYSTGTLTGNVDGFPLGWLDEERLLFNRYAPPNGGWRAFNGAAIANSAGQVLATPTLPEMYGIQVLDSNVVYSPNLNVILEVSSGNTLWSSATTVSSSEPHLGGATDSYVGFASGATVRAEPR